MNIRYSKRMLTNKFIRKMPVQFGMRQLFSICFVSWWSIKFAFVGFINFSYYFFWFVFLILFKRKVSFWNIVSKSSAVKQDMSLVCLDFLWGCTVSWLFVKYFVVNFSYTFRGSIQQYHFFRNSYVKLSMELKQIKHTCVTINCLYINNI